MKANVKNIRECDKAHNSRKEKGFFKGIAVLDNRGGSIVTARFYQTGIVCYCVVWVHGDDASGLGGGRASGYGYHKPSAALSEALNRAGITLDEPISGRGDKAMREACEAVARAVTSKRKLIVHVAHA